jgi:integrase
MRKRKRFQTGSVSKVHGSWLGRWREDGELRSQTLGRVSEMTKSQAKEKLAEILAPINAAAKPSSPHRTFGDFVRHTFFPFQRRKWKRSTKMTSEDRIKFHLIGGYGPRMLSDITRDELQHFLDGKSKRLSFSTVDHLRWDLVAIFRMAVSEGCTRRNPAELVFTPREAKKGEKLALSIKEVNRLFEILELRERLIVKLAVIGGMRPGEIFALRRGGVMAACAEVKERLYRGDIDTPKTEKSVRVVGLSEGLSRDLDLWLETYPAKDRNAWLFPSERTDKPIRKDNVWRRYVRPKLKTAGMGWVDFHVLRRSHSSLMRELNIDPKVVADQQGHTLDVNMNVYTQTSLESRINAVNTLESALVN